MSSAVGSTSAALSRPFLFDDDAESGAAPVPAAFARSGKAAVVAEDLKKPAGKQSGIEIIRSTINDQKSTIPLTSASHLEIRPAPEMASSGISALDRLTGGLPRGCLTEICGPASSGRTSVMLAALAAATRRGEFCALLDASDALDPYSVAAAGVDLDRFLWVRCADKTLPARQHLSADFKHYRFAQSESSQSEYRLEQVLRATDLLLESGGFGLIILDLADVPLQSARRIPLATWFRFRRSVEHKPTILLAIEQQPIAGSCSSLLLNLQVPGSHLSALNSTNHAEPFHAHLLSGLQIRVERTRSRLDRKPAHSVRFETTTEWAGSSRKQITQLPNYKITK
jgi:recA bacterial DNA recombination protein